MITNSTEDRVRKIVGRLTGKLEGLEPDQPLATLGVDSVIAVEILIAIEEEFNIEFHDADVSMAAFENLSSLVALVARGYTP